MSELELKLIPDDSMQRIKEELKKWVNFEVDNDKQERLGRPPVLILAFDRKGNIIVCKSDKEFNVVGPYDLREKPFINTTVATLTTTKGVSTTDQKITITKANIFLNQIGGESLTDEWPDF